MDLSGLIELPTGSNRRFLRQEFTPLLRLDVDRYMIVPEASGAVKIFLDTTVHRPGVVKLILIPPGHADSLDVPADLNVVGDAFDDTKMFALEVQSFAVGAEVRFASIARSFDARSAVAPTIISATIADADNDHIVVVFSEDVYLKTLSHVTLDYDTVVGTVRTIDSVAGNGTDTLTFALSGKVTDGDVINLVVRTTPAPALGTQDGVAIVGGSTPITNNVTAPTIVSATVEDADDNKLVVVFSEAVDVASLVGLTLLFSAGAVATLTAIESGNGTATVGFTISRSILATDVFDLVVGASNTIDDLNDNEMDADTVAVTNNVVA